MTEARAKLLVLTTTLPAVKGDSTPSFVLDLSLCLAESFDLVVLAPRVARFAPSNYGSSLRVVRFPYFLHKLEGLASDAIIPTLRRRPWRMVEAPFLILQMLRWAMRLATTEEFAAIIAHWAFPGGWVARRINRRLGLPYTVTLHGADVFALRSRIFGRLRKKVLEDAAAVLPVSQDIASTIELDPDDPRVHVVPMGALLPSIDDRPVREEDQFLFVGRLAEKKGVDIAIRALAMCPKGRLLVVGSGPEEPALRNLTQTLNLTNRVTFAGRMEKADVFRALQRALALVIPSRVAKGGDKDGTPVVLAEAAATGTPVIASELAGLAEQVQPGVTGLLVTPESVEELASAMAMLLDHPEKAGDMGSTAREAFEYGPLNIRTTAQRYAEVLEQVLGADR